MESCSLDLGCDAWQRLTRQSRTKQSLTGTMSWNGGPALPVTVSLRGAHSRRFPKRSLQVKLSEAPLTDEPPVGHTIRRIHLNADFIDPALMRSALSFWLFSLAGVPAPRCRHTALTVSGDFAGVYLALESVDSDFCLRRGWSPGPIFYAVNRNANFGLVSPFTRSLKNPLHMGYASVGRASKEPLCRMLEEINLATEECFPAVAERWFDTDLYLGWLMVAVFTGNRDGFVHNYALSHDPEYDRFRIIPWDYDATWGLDIHGRPSPVDRVPVTGWNKLTHRLLAVPRYREQYRRSFQAALDSIFGSDSLSPEVERMSLAIAHWVERDPHRRGDFATESRRLLRWAEERRAFLASELVAL